MSLLDSILILCEGVHERIADERMRLIEWRVLRMIGEEPGLTGRQLAERTQISPGGMERILGILRERSLIHDPEVGFEKSLECSSGWGKSAKVPSREIQAATGVRRVASTSRERVSVRLDRSTPIFQTPGVTASAKETPAKKAFPLKPLLDFVRESVSDRTLGQLAVYRLFMTVPEPLLQASRLASVNLDDATLMLTDEKLVEALVSGAATIVGRPFEAPAV
ncbi:MAG: helix-turn-helix domain-containing protein [Verrucomicrobiota bacterium]